MVELEWDGKKGRRRKDVAVTSLGEMEFPFWIWTLDLMGSGSNLSRLGWNGGGWVYDR